MLGLGKKTAIKVEGRMKVDTLLLVSIILYVGPYLTNRSPLKLSFFKPI